MSKSRSHKNAVRILIAIALAAGFFDARRDAEASAISTTSATSADLFAEQVAPIFAARCIACHGARVQRGGLDLRTEAAARRGGARGPAIVPGRSAESLLYRLITHQAEPAMPMGLDRLKASEIAAIARWIDASTGPPHAAPPVTPVREPGAPITKEDRAFWSFRPIVRAALPEVKNRAWVRNAIDAFVLRRLEENQLAPAPPADPRTLLRRVYFDLTGLPPSPDEIAGFIKDPSDVAYEKVIERLLASPHYGERWGRHWLDLARYADSGGYEFDIDRPHAWRYRDWVIKAFNDDLPYDRFIREQLAGDQLHPGDAAALIPTGFCRNGPTVDNANNEETRTDELDDMVTTTSSVFLGLTVGCARCHDHKYDPIPQRDYYRLQAVFFPFKKTDQLLVSQTEADAFKSRQREIDALVKPLKEEIAEIEGPVRARLLAEKVEFHVRLAESSGALAGRTREQLRAETAARFAKDVQLQAEEIEALLTPEALGERKRLLTEIEQINQTRPRPLPAAMGITDREDPGQAHLLLRGDWRSKGEKVGPGLPAVFTDGTDVKDLASRDRRRQLADWIARAENPLTARVAVNRIWQYHFGQGIVRTPSDFGATGDRPSHPELLDYLATEFIARGWSWKAMHRLILTSSAYRQSSRYDAAASARDPENRWLWRSHPRRIEAEAIRDSILVASGKLNREMGGPGIYPRIDPAVINTGSRPRWPLEAREGPEVWRRSVYIFVKRSVLLPLLEVYDCPVTTVSAPVRATSTVSPQALALLNNEFVLEQARFFAWRVLSEAGAERSAQINRAFSIALGRAPSAREAAWSLEFLNRQTGLHGARRQAEAPTAALRDLCHALFNLNEFVYLD